MSPPSATPSRFRRWATRALYAGALLACVAFTSTTALQWFQRGEDTPALRGRKVAHDLGCFSCHGEDGRGGVVDPGARGRIIPGWSAPEIATMAANDQEVREWILDGLPSRFKGLDYHLGRTPLMPMPAYQDKLSPSDLEDLMAYLRAISGFDTGMSALVFEGQVEASRQGCFACHGPGGIGGIANAHSFKGHIPAWDGEEYPELVENEAELREWILDGHPGRLWENPAARLFLDAQVIQMPGYRDHLSEDQVTKLVAYIQWRSEGRRLPPTYDAVPPTFPAETGRPASPAYRSPQDLCLSRDGSRLYVANYTANLVSEIDTASHRVVREFPVGDRPSQVALAADEKSLFVSCTWAGHIEVLDLASGLVTARLTAQEEPTGLVTADDGQTLFVTNVVAHSVSALDLTGRRPRVDIPVGSQPRYAALTPDQSRLLVSNGLSPWVSVIDTHSLRETGRYDLGRASMLREIVCSPDGRWAYVANLVSHNEVPTVQMERGWINSNGFTILDLARPGRRVTLLLDTLFSGAANPAGACVSPDGRWLAVTLAGIHEVALVDLPRALALAEATPDSQVIRLEEDVEILAREGIARRVPAGGLGPRSIAWHPTTGELWVANYFSDSITVLDALTGAVRTSVPLGTQPAMSAWRQGELMTNDARITYQNWISCASCHQEDTSSDGLNWDLANDGIGNPKNNKSLQDTHDTPPAMWSGVRQDLRDGVGAGERFQGFVPMAHVQGPITEYLSHPDRAPNPYRHADPAALARGREIFAVAGCIVCHPGPTFSDCKPHDLGFGTPNDFRNRFDTPSLRSTHRTGPYLHDGRAETLEALFTEHNPLDLHGRTRGLTAQELNDLLTYLRSL